jgi:hypothetical protein
MKQLIQMDFFLIGKMSRSDICTSVLDSAYEVFVEDVFMKTSGTSGTVALLQSLCYVRVEFMGLQRRLPVNRKKGDRTSFLDLQKQLLIRRLEDSDRRPVGKRGLD